MLESEKEIYKEVINVVDKAHDDISNTTGQLCSIYYNEDTERVMDVHVITNRDSLTAALVVS